MRGLLPRRAGAAREAHAAQSAERREGDAPSDHSRRTRSGQNLLSLMSCSVRGSCFGK